MSTTTAATTRGSPASDTRRRPLILHLIDEFKVGGAQTHLVTVLASALSARSVDHHVVGLFGDGPIAGRLRELGVRVDVLDLRPLFARRRFLAAAGVLETLIAEARPDVVEAHLSWSRLLGLFAAWRAGVPRRIAFEQGDVYLSSWKFRLANRIGQRFADRIVVCSEALREWNLRTHGIAPDRLAVLHNCVDLARFRPRASAAASSRFDLPAGRTRFVAVGTLGEGVDKRTDVLIRALAIARTRGVDGALVVCGDGERRWTLEKLAAALDVEDRVRFLGTCVDIPEILAACDVFCHAAPFEPFGIACVEAAAAGLPAIVPNSGGIPEIVIDGRTGWLYPPLDAQALADRMVQLHESPAMRRDFGRAARRDAEHRFSVEGYVHRLHDLYQLPDRGANP